MRDFNAICGKCKPVYTDKSSLHPLRRCRLLETARRRVAELEFYPLPCVH